MVWRQRLRLPPNAERRLPPALAAFLLATAGHSLLSWWGQLLAALVGVALPYLRRTAIAWMVIVVVVPVLVADAVHTAHQGRAETRPILIAPPTTAAPTTTTIPNAGRAPWDGPRLPANKVPAVLLTEWRRADNRHQCAPIAPSSLGEGAGAQPRRAVATGGWGITYEHPKGNFTIMGTSELASGGVDYDKPWPYRRRWDDGSVVGYGISEYTSGQDAVYMAYLVITGQDCLYNVFTNLGKRHLEYLLDHLRLINVPSPG